MEPLSYLEALHASFKKILNLYLKNRGLKTVPIDEFKEEVVKIKPDYTTKSPQCVQETENGARFYMSEYQNPGYEKYFEIHGNTRRYFWNDSKQFLWIVRKK
jgi:hypothetical protein